MAESAPPRTPINQRFDCPRCLRGQLAWDADLYTSGPYCPNCGYRPRTPDDAPPPINRDLLEVMDEDRARGRRHSNGVKL